MDKEKVKQEFENGRWEKDAQETVENEEKMQKLVEEEEMLLRNKALWKVWNSLKLLFRYVRAVNRGTYPNYSVWALTKIVAVLLYVVNPLDLIPDILPGVGFLDDIIAVGIVINITAKELEKFQKWELEKCYQKKAT